MNNAVWLMGNTYPVAQQTVDNKEWQKALADAYIKHNPRCCCFGKGERKLAIRHYKSGAYGVAKMPNTGEEHHLNCDHYRINPNKSGQQVYDEGVLEEKNDGTQVVRLLRGMTIREPVAPELAPYERTSNGKTYKRHRAMTVLGLLHLIWETAGFHRWYPKMEKKRSNSTLEKYLGEAFEKIEANRQNLDELSLVVFNHNEGEGKKEKIFTLFERAYENRKRLIVIGEVAKFSEIALSCFVYRVQMKAYSIMPELSIAPDDWDKLFRKKVNSIKSQWKSGSKVVFIAHVEPVINNGEISGKVCDLGLMPVTDNWIPVESSYENDVALKLTNEHRSFIKPLRYDASTQDYFPDFILTDTDIDVGMPLEVFGRTDVDYQEHRKEKIKYYNRLFGEGNWWWWDAFKKVPIPDFPAKKQWVKKEGTAS